MFETDCQVFLKIMEGRRVEFSLTGKRKVFVEVMRDWSCLFGRFWRRDRCRRCFLFGKELFEILGRVTSLQIRNALWQRLFLAVLLVDSFGVFLLKEDAHIFRIVHKLKINYTGYDITTTSIPYNFIYFWSVYATIRTRYHRYPSHQIPFWSFSLP